MRQPWHSPGTAPDTITTATGFHVDAHGTEVVPASTVRTNNLLQGTVLCLGTPAARGNWCPRGVIETRLYSVYRYL
jgi:hypothetical protein